MFAVCQSSEMQHLTLAERTGIARFVKEGSRGRVTVIASGHISEDINDQIDELKAMQDTGVDAVVMISSRIVRKDEDDEAWKRNAERILTEIPLSLWVFMNVLPLSSSDVSGAAEMVC